VGDVGGGVHLGGGGVVGVGVSEAPPLLVHSPPPLPHWSGGVVGSGVGGSSGTRTSTWVSANPNTGAALDTQLVTSSATPSPWAMSELSATEREEDLDEEDECSESESATWPVNL
jgi:hypothetical protein